MNKNKPGNREIVFALLAAGVRVGRRLDRALAMVKGISLSELQILLALRDEHVATATRVDLAEAVGLTPSGVTRALRPLEKLGYVVTKRDVRDARRSLASLTPAGRELTGAGSKVVDEVVSGIAALDGLAAADRTTIAELLVELARE